MTQELRITTVNGSPTLPSKTSVVLDALASSVLARTPGTVHKVEISSLAGLPLGVTRASLPAHVSADLQAIETADLIIAASPVYKGSYTGLFKYLFDLVDQYALVDVPVLLAATGGSERHTLVIEHQLRPLFSFFQAAVAPIGVYAHSQEFDGYAIRDQALLARIDRAAERALASLVPHSTLRELNSSGL